VPMEEEEGLQSALKYMADFFFGERFLYVCGRVLESTRKAISTFIVTSFLLYILMNGCVPELQSLLLPPMLSRQHQAGQTFRTSLARCSNN